MSNYGDIDTAVNGIRDNLHRLADRVLQELNRETSEAMDAAYREFGEWQEQRIEQIFRSAVDRFYASYTPESYSRSGSLYDVFSPDRNDTGMIILNPPGYDELYDTSGMREDLFQTVFKEGYHGGAKTIASGKADVWGAHPSPGIAYYRKPGWVKYPNMDKKRWHRYGKWGRPAVQTKSAYRMVAEDLQRIEGGEMFDTFKRISDEHNNAAVERVKNMIPALQAEIYG